MGQRSNLVFYLIGLLVGSLNQLWHPLPNIWHVLAGVAITGVLIMIYVSVVELLFPPDKGGAA